MSQPRGGERQSPYSSFFFFFNDTATTEIYTLSLHDALPICLMICNGVVTRWCGERLHLFIHPEIERSEEHTSELQSLAYLVCRLLLEKKKKKIIHPSLQGITNVHTTHRLFLSPLQHTTSSHY